MLPRCPDHGHTRTWWGERPREPLRPEAHFLGHKFSFPHHLPRTFIFFVIFCSSLSAFDGFKIIFCPDLSALENDFQFVARRIRRKRPAQRRTRCQRCDHFQRLNSQRPRGKTRRVATRNANAPDCMSRQRTPQNLAQRRAENRRSSIFQLLCYERVRTSLCSVNNYAAPAL